jgi:hypothetical protein
MDEETWSSLKIEIGEYLQADESLDAGLKQVCELNLTIGDNNPNEREAARGALKALLKGRDGTPFRKGQKSSIPASVRVVIDQVVSVVEEASIAYFNHDGLIGAITKKQNRSGGGLYADAEEYAKAEGVRARNRLAKWYKAKEWDGNKDSLLS